MTRPARELWTLGKYLALASSALTVLLTVLLIGVIEYQAVRNAAANIGENLRELAGQTADRMDRALHERFRELQLMAARLDRHADWDEVRAELDEAKKTYRFYTWLGATDARGIVRAASGRALEGRDVSQQRWWRNAREGVYLGEVHDAQVPGRDEGTRQRFFDIAVPLKKGGVLGAYVSWAWGNETRNAIFGQRARTGIEPVIVGDDGLVLLGPPDVEGQRLSLGSLEAGSGRGYAVETWPNGETYLVGYATSRGHLSSPGFGWRVLVRQDVDVAYASLREIQLRVLVWGASLAVLFSLLGWMASRAITFPLLHLADAARRLEQGENVEVQPPSRSFREVAVLASALNSMLAKVRDKTEQLRQLNAQLEQRVEQRTAELRDAFERVRSSEHRTRTIIESAPDPFIGMDLQGRIVDWSGQAEVLFGWRREEVLGRQAADLLMPQRYAHALELALAEFARTGTSSLLERPLERTLVDRSGRELPVELRIGLVSTGEERFFIAFVQDISQRREVARMKDEFVSTVSHELRTPLTAIYGSLNLLASGAAGEMPQEAGQLLAISQESTERLVRLIDDLLDLEKIASGKIEYRIRNQPLAPLVEQAVRDMQPFAEALRVRIVPDLRANPVGAVDADRIVQVCVNLLSNAAKFSPPDAEVRVTLDVVDGRARIGVVDHGPGVPPEFGDRVFDRFAQADSSHRRAKGGTGLGLAICHSIVEAHAGRLGFTSEPDVRTEFFVELPLPAADQNEVR